MSYLVPNPDTFDAGSPWYSPNVLGWMEFEPIAASYAIGHLHDGYSGKSPKPQHGACAAANYRAGGGGTVSDLECWHRREVFAADVSVTAEFFVYIADSSEVAMQTQWIGTYAVLARISGGTGVDAFTTDVRYTDGNCYIVEQTTSASNDVTFTLKRINSGVATTLATKTYAASFASGIAWDEGWRLRLVVKDNGSNVDYEVWWEDFEDATQSYPAVLVLSGTDTSPLTGTGRCGFGMSAPEALTGGFDRAPCCASFEVADAEKWDQIAFREDWVRTLADLNISSTSDALGVSGNVLMGDFTHDQFTDASGGAALAQTSAGFASMSFGSTTKDGEPFLSYRKQQSVYDQSVYAVARFTSGTSTGALPDGTLAGVLVRGSIPGQTSTPVHPGTADATLLPYFKGYALIVFVNDSESPLQRVQLMRYTGQSSGAGTTIARRNANSQVPLGSDFSVRLDVALPGDLAPTGDPDTANVVLKAYLDTGSGWTQIALGSPSSNVTVDGNGTVTDADSSRVQSGESIGLVAAGVNTTRDVRFNSWGTELRDNLDTVPLAMENELQGSTATFKLNDVVSVAFTVKFTRSQPTIAHVYQSGHRSARPAFGDASGGISRRTISAQAEGMPPEEHQRLADFFDRMSGAQEPFLFDLIDGTTLTVCFVSGSLKSQQQAPGVYSVAFDMLELVDTA